MHALNYYSFLTTAIEDEQRTAPFSGVEVFNKDLLKHVETTEKKPPLPTPQGMIHFYEFQVLKQIKIFVSK